MKNLISYIKESLLDDEDVLMKDTSNEVIKKLYTDWLVNRNMIFRSVELDKNGINLKGDFMFMYSSELPPSNIKLNSCDRFSISFEDSQQFFDNPNYLPNVTDSIFIASRCKSTIHDWRVKTSKLYIGKDNKIGKNFKIDIINPSGLQANIGRIKLDNINTENDFGGLVVKNKSNSYLQLNLSDSPIAEKIIKVCKKEMKSNVDSYQAIINCVDKFINLKNLEKRFEKLFCIIFKYRDLKNLKVNHFYASATPKLGDLVLYKSINNDNWNIFRKTL